MSRYAAQVDNAAVFFQRMALHLLHCCLHHEAGAGHINLERLIKYDQVDTSPSLSYPSRPPWLRGFRSQSRQHSWRGGGDVQDQQQFEKQPWSSQLSLTHPTCRTLNINSKVKIRWVVIYMLRSYLACSASPACFSSSIFFAPLWEIVIICDKKHKQYEQKQTNPTTVVWAWIIQLWRDGDHSNF